MPNYNNPYGGYSPYPMENNFRGYDNQYNNYARNARMNQYAFVNGIEGAKSFQLQPNQSIMLMDSDSPVCYMKQANSVGQSTLRYFKLVETTEEEIRNGGKKAEPSPEYALKSDIESLSKRIDELTRRFDRKPKNESKEN